MFYFVNLLMKTLHIDHLSKNLEYYLSMPYVKNPHVLSNVMLTGDFIYLFLISKLLLK